MTGGAAASALPAPSGGPSLCSGALHLLQPQACPYRHLPRYAGHSMHCVSFPTACRCTAGAPRRLLGRLWAIPPTCGTGLSASPSSTQGDTVGPSTALARILECQQALPGLQDVGGSGPAALCMRCGGRAGAHSPQRCLLNDLPSLLPRLALANPVCRPAGGLNCTAGSQGGHADGIVRVCEHLQVPIGNAAFMCCRTQTRRLR